ncbi:uncharacterized protein MONOS_14964 [Monocercomonoides exilis]|uniref:uncharacterized protein n=1 Tax=Monocercomonoides exilis TaxID=2049356 RepID=UPI003559D522|nr:hypothetical protein MONOS_14964 [Monocercomonoides exilis]|eukprot:MONOS_14964.1-p1 / transcript=MONOS_14964.1 / gene=MONOS_14964 / organism=Monocercomonoides_exilis_PA203 / gene_product=unspecified product / transcript_product=unspecified product / location=Mono_scaffold01116:4453-4671(-) / protein_length=73 / sequence_SO=supercontig / SO=protein_coding / is_pseudo=false
MLVLSPRALRGYIVARRGVLYGGVVCFPCGAFSDAFRSAGGAAPVACSVCGKEVQEQANLCSGRRECVTIDL